MSVRWSEEQLKDYEARRSSPGGLSVSPPKAPRAPARPTDALGRLPSGQMNKTEAAYAQHLELLRAAGEIAWYQFEAIKLRLAPKTTYTPDFAVMTSDGELTFREVKGFWRSTGRVKIKVAAELFPFRFIAVTRRAGAWIEERFGGRGQAIAPGDRQGTAGFLQRYQHRRPGHPPGGDQAPTRPVSSDVPRKSLKYNEAAGSRRLKPVPRHQAGAPGKPSKPVGSTAAPGQRGKRGTSTRPRMDGGSDSE